MRYFRHILSLLLLGIMLSCAMTHTLQRHTPTANIKLPNKGFSQTPEVEDVEKAVARGHKLAMNEGRDSAYLVGTELQEDGELAVLGGNIEAVYVKAKFKSVAERNGEISLEFVVGMPASLQNSNWGLELTPIINNHGVEEELQRLSIRGEMFSELQRRQYWQMNKYLNRIVDDTTDLTTTTSLVAKYYEAYNGYLTAKQPRKAANLAHTYKETISFPYLTDSRLDSVLIRKGDINYYYTQTYKPTKNTSKLSLYFRGKIGAIDRSEYALTNSDTITFNISSMISLTDNDPRYMIQVIDKYVQVRDRNYINFLIGDTRVIDTLRDNRAQLTRIEHLMDTLINQYQFFVDSVVITASSSPEGAVALNTRLARDRAASIKRRLVQKFGHDVDTLIVTRHIAEDWMLLKQMIRHHTDVPHWEQIIKLIDQSRDMDATEHQIRSKYPKDYAFLREVIYPQLRAVDFRYNLRRVDMVKDTIQLTVLDTTYMRGVQQLRDRDYTGALNTLYNYKCHNLAIVMLSLGYDDAALEILQGLPSRERTARSEYLIAIALSRLNKPQEGLEHYLQAIKEDPVLKFRGNLDPEIQILYKQNNVTSSN